MEKTKQLTRSSKIILTDLFRARRPLSVKKIAERNEMSWKTANDNIKRLENKGLVKCKRSERRTYCQITRPVRDLL